MTRPGSDAAAWLRSAISYQIERGDVMSEDNGFVERPTRRPRGRNPMSVESRLRVTADNGRAIPIKERASVSGAYIKRLRAEGLLIHTQKQPDGTYLAWCERIEPVKAP